jgi:hypothetical protein
VRSGREGHPFCTFSALPRTDVKVGWIPSSADPRIASARLRCQLPVRYLREARWQAEVFDASRRDEYGVVVFQKAYDDASLSMARSLRRGGTITVFDLCDNHFHNPDGLPELAERARRLARMLDTVDAVSVSSAPLRELVADRDPPVIDDALDEFTIPRAAPPVLRAAHDLFRLSRRVHVVWYGNAGTDSPAFGLVHLPRIVPALNELHRSRPLDLTVISNSKERYERALADARFPSRYVEWAWKTFPRSFTQHDFCVIPIEVNPFTICKTANRVALSLRLGVPVIADPIPSFEPFAGAMLVDAWPESMRRYAFDAELRRRHVDDGRAVIDALYTPERVVAQWGGFFERLVGPANP